MSVASPISRPPMSVSRRIAPATGAADTMLVPTVTAQYAS